jgi:endoglucanase
MKFLINIFFISLLFSLNIYSAEVLINQAGYLPSSPKFVYYTAYADSFFVVEENSQTIYYRGSFVLETENDPATGLTLYKGNFSSLKREGSYFIKISTDDFSYSFTISSEIYNELYKQTLKAFYFQRCGSSLLENHAGEFNRQTCHTNDGYFHSSTGSTGFHSSRGGWHDAGDFGKYVVNAGITVGTLLMAFELFPEKFCNDDLNIPESENGIPDLLDEVKYEIDWLLTMQHEDGGVYFKLTREQFSSFIMPSQDNATRYIYQLSTTATGDFAAVFARFARLYKEFDSTFSFQCLSAAEKAWDYLSSQESIVPPGGFHNPSGTATGEYGDSNDGDERLWAAAELFETTGLNEYKDYFEFSYNLSGVINSTMWWGYVKPLAQFTYLNSQQSSADQSIKNIIRNKLNDYCSVLLDKNTANGFGVTLNPGNYVWGSNSSVLNDAIILLIAYEENSTRDYLNAALDQLNYIYGINAHNISFVTGTGTNRVMHPHHRTSAADGIDEPIPGMLAGGPNEYLSDPVLQQHFNSLTPPALCFIDDVGSYASNEIAINWNAPLVFVTGYFSSYGTRSVEDETGSLIPHGFKLEQNYPNPFNPETTIIYSLSFETNVKLKIYNSLGEEAADLVDGTKEAGTYKYIFNASDLSSGIYFCRLISENYISTKKMILIK